MTLVLDLGAKTRLAMGTHRHHWDRLRVLAVLDIVSWHLAGTHLFGGLGLPLFHMLSVALSVARPAPPAWRPFVLRRARRLLWPWLFWSLCIAVVGGLRNRASGLPPWHGLTPRMALYGTSIHLWFLPFTLLSTGSARALQRRVEGKASEPSVLGGAFLLALALLPLPLWFGGGWPFEQWLFSLPACLLGFVLGRLSGRSPSEQGRLALTTVCCLFAMWWLALAHADTKIALHGLRFLLAFVALTCAVGLPDGPDRVTTFLRPLLLGVYIVHPVLYEQVLNEPVWRLGLGQLASARVIIGLSCSVLFVWLLRKTPLRRLL